MYFSEFIKILKDNEYINDELHQKLSRWDRKNSFHYTNIRENQWHKIELICHIDKLNDWSDLYNFSLEIIYEVYPQKPTNLENFSISVPHHILIVGQIEFNKINNIKIKEYYDKINLRNLFKEIDEMTDIEREAEERSYDNWNNNQ